MSVTPKPTPNPNAFKFTVQGHAFAKPETYASREAAEGTAFAEALFQIPGVVSIFCTSDFVTVTKEPAADWAHIVPAAQKALEANL